MTVKLTTKLDTKGIDQMIIKATVTGGPKAVTAAAKTVQGRAAMRAPFDKGFLKGSIFAEFQSPLTWHVNVKADYGLFQEVGTKHMAAQPFLVPAVEETLGDYIIEWKKVFV